jgi:pilus assembly protein Flp/PilA
MFFAPKEKGQGLVEYALIIILVLVVLLTVWKILGPTVGPIIVNYFTKINPTAVP